MTQTTLVKERPILDLNFTHFDHRIKDIRVIGSWMTDGSRDPCLVLAHGRKDLQDITPCVVPLQSAWKWAEETCDNIECAMMAMDFCPHLGKNMNHNDDVIQVIWTVRERLHDLIMMPPAPRRPLELQGHVTITHGDDVVSQKDVWDDV